MVVVLAAEGSILFELLLLDAAARGSLAAPTASVPVIVASVGLFASTQNGLLSSDTAAAIIGAALLLYGAASVAPQPLLLWRNRTIAADGISGTQWVMPLAAVLCWMLYGAGRHDAIIVISAGLVLPLVFMTVVLLWRGRRPADSPQTSEVLSVSTPNT